MVPFEQVNIDLIGPLESPSSSGHKCILCLIDSATKWIEAVCLKTLTAEEACDALRLIFSRIGIPRILISDSETILVSRLNKELCVRLGIKLRNSSVLHPEENAAVERWNQTLKRMLHHVVISDKPRQWHLTLPYLLWAYRELPNSTTGVSPFQLVYGRMIRGPLGVLRDTWSTGKEPEINIQKMDTVRYLDQL